MPTYLYQFRREQRAEFEIEAESQEEADKLAETRAAMLDLSSKDDTSDDKGELELLETHPTTAEYAEEGEMEMDYNADRRELWRRMAELTKPKCGASKGCAPFKPGGCCDPMYCDMAFAEAKRQGEELEPTGHERLPLMGEDGCTAPPHLRPMCTLHVCIISNLGFDPEDQAWTEQYFELRGAIDAAELERLREAPDLASVPEVR